MLVKLDHVAILAARHELDHLSTRLEVNLSRAASSSPIHLESLSGLPAAAQWMREGVHTLDEVAALALLLDTDPGQTGPITVTLPGDAWDPATWIADAADSRFGPGFVEATGLTGPDLNRFLATLASVGHDTVPGGVMSPTELRDFIIDHPRVAQALQNTRPMGPGPAGTLYSLTLPMMTEAGGAAAAEEQRRLDIRELFEGLSPADAAILAMTYPATVGNLSGVPFTNRADAHDVNIVAALAEETTRLEDLEAQHAHNQQDWDFLGLNNNDLEGPIADQQDRIDLYRSILRDNRQILYFDPAGDGAIAELHGTIDSTTNNIGVLVPGTTADLASFESGVAARSRSFMNRNLNDDLVMISWLGGDFPDSIALDAPDPSYSQDLGPRLANFSLDVELEQDRAGAESAMVTYGGHSYGGAVVGIAETYGLRADRVLHMASAGMGHDVHSPADLPESQANVDRYSMTAPGDLIGVSQGVQMFGIGHGADPDDFPGTVHLHTGNDPEGQPIRDVSSHTGIFTPGGDSWNNMYEVFTGGTVETHRTERWGVDEYGNVVHQGWNDDGEWVDIE